ncbi:charged multivesicular body protein 7 isoform X3 [Zootermopsis nevadensis]|uniref:charged multivesicular body protein 7 isoform X3 n=1 Tax=Zootermopsis nevadensis TaxID=136037 RepID=UPI000B8E3BBF|nr:charged multivesicular body protein 7 isoform X3 [Zootermopsis nevadensis]
MAGVHVSFLLQSSRVSCTRGLRKAFQRKGRTPVCLPTVIETMHRNGLLVVKEEFFRIPPQQTWTAWTIDLLIKKPVSWTFNKVSNFVFNSMKMVSEDILYVHIGACKDLGNKLLASVNCNRLIELNELAVLCGQEDLEQLQAIVHGLCQQGKAAIKQGNAVLIKLGDPHISDLDVGVYTLQCNEQTLTRHIEQLEAEKQMAMQEARMYISKNMKQAARNCLRKKHVLDSCTDKRTSALDNIHLLLTRLQEAKSDVKVLEAYKLGVAALKSTLKGSGLTEDSAADIMVQVEEVLDVHREIQATLAQPLEAEDGLEDELTQLLVSQDTLEQDLTKLSIISDLPEPPDTMPAIHPPHRKLPIVEPAL